MSLRKYLQKRLKEERNPDSVPFLKSPEFFSALINIIPTILIGVGTILITYKIAKEQIKVSQDLLEKQLSQSKDFFDQQSKEDGEKTVAQQVFYTKQTELDSTATIDSRKYFQEQSKINELQIENSQQNNRQQKTYYDFQNEYNSKIEKDRMLFHKQQLRETCLKILHKTEYFSIFDIDTSEVKNIPNYYTELIVLIEKEIDNPYLHSDSIILKKWIVQKNWFKSSYTDFLEEMKFYLKRNDSLDKRRISEGFRSKMFGQKMSWEEMYNYIIQKKDDAIKKGWYDD